MAFCLTEDIWSKGLAQAWRKWRATHRFCLSLKLKIENPLPPQGLDCVHACDEPVAGDFLKRKLQFLDTGALFPVYISHGRQVNGSGFPVRVQLDLHIEELDSQLVEVRPRG
jgi:hypothetical protein